jgi:hypothetical protein
LKKEKLQIVKSKNVDEKKKGKNKGHGTTSY